MDIQALIADRKREMLQEAALLKQETYGKFDGKDITGEEYLKEAREAYQKRHNREMPINVEAVLMQGLKGTKEQIVEAAITKSSDLGTFVDYGYQLVTAVLPNLVLEEVASLQPLKVRTGDVFWLDYLFATAKGKIKAGDKLFDATSGPSINLNYSNEVVEDEELLLSGTTSTGTVAYTPIRADEGIILKYTVGTVDYEVTGTVSNGTCSFTQGSTLNSATLILTSGVYNIEFQNAPVASSVSLTYQFTFEDNLSTIPKVKIALRQLSVTARQYKLASQYTLDSSYDLAQAHGVDIDPLMVAALASTIRYEIDGLGLNKIFEGAGSYQITWNKTKPDYIDVFQHYRSFMVALTEASNIIYNSTKMVGGNVVVAGLDVMNVIESIGAPFWEPVLPGGEMGTFAGPHVAGILNKRWKVIKNPTYKSNDFIVAHKGGNYLESGFVFAPYRPLYTTPAIAWEDDTVRRGMATSAGMRMLNSNMFVKGKLTT